MRLFVLKILNANNLTFLQFVSHQCLAYKLQYLSITGPIKTKMPSQNQNNSNNSMAKLLYQGKVNTNPMDQKYVNLKENGNAILTVR